MARMGLSHVQPEAWLSALFSGILVFSFTDGSDVVCVSSRSSVFFFGVRLRFNVCEVDGEDCPDRTCDIKVGSSHIDGIISSGPDINDPEVSIVFGSSSLFVSDCCRGSGLFVSVPSFCCSLSGSDGTDGTTQDSPRTVLSWGRDKVVDMGRYVSSAVLARHSKHYHRKATTNLIRLLFQLSIIRISVELSWVCKTRTCEFPFAVSFSPSGMVSRYTHP